MNIILDKKGEIFENQEGSLIFVCCICNGTNYGLAEVEDHLKTHIPNVKVAVPDRELGLSVSDDSAAIQRDSLKGLSNLTIPCSLCSNLFPCSGLRDQHIAAEHLSSRSPFGCCICKISFADERNYIRHMISHIQPNYKICPDCGQVLKAADLTNHISGRDSSPLNLGLGVLPKRNSLRYRDFGFEIHKTFKYPHGPKSFFSRQRPVVVDEISKSPKSYECEKCGRIFTNKYKLRYHLFGHIEPKPFKCHVCGHGFTALSALNLHVRRHENIKPYKCPQCPKSFCSTHDQRLHIRSHTGEKKYVCSTCGKGSSTASNLSKHIRYVHNKEKNHGCEFEGCGRRFFARQDLRIHVRTHTGERPLNCKMCSKSFSDPKTLRDHFKRLHARKEF